MNQNIKNVLGVAIIITVLLVGYAAISGVNSYGESIQPSSFRSFVATGEGKATAIPDVAEFSFQVITEGGSNIASLQTQNTASVNKAIAFVKSQGVADKDIQTQYYNINPRYQTYNCRTIPETAGTGAVSPSNVQPCPPSSIVGYTITQSIDVKMRDFSKIGSIMNGIVSAGANQVGSLSFTMDDPSSVQNQARANAIANAKAQAAVIAQAGGFKIGRLLSVQENNPYPIYAKAYGMGGGAAMESAVAAPAPAIQPGSQEISETVTLQYEIQ
ncbi:MAG: SIMPL domain-containing protein [Patescibacteria group bacterium]|nr:SIMPL domain-containing protein [Patescibacteria group bacterium]